MIMMIFVLGKALLSLLFYTDNPYFFYYFPQIFIPTFLLKGTWKPAYFSLHFHENALLLSSFIARRWVGLQTVTVPT